MDFLSSMNISLLILSQISIYAALVTLLMQRTHFLIALFSLEGVMLSVVLFLPIIIGAGSIIMPSIRIVLLTFGACEARLGLSLMVNMSRFYGSDIISLNMLRKC